MGREDSMNVGDFDGTFEGCKVGLRVGILVGSVAHELNNSK